MLQLEKLYVIYWLSFICSIVRCKCIDAKCEMHTLHRTDTSDGMHTEICETAFEWFNKMKKIIFVYSVREAMKFKKKKHIKVFKSLSKRNFHRKTFSCKFSWHKRKKKKQLPSITIGCWHCLKRVSICKVGQNLHALQCLTTCSMPVMVVRLWFIVKDCWDIY